MADTKTSALTAASAALTTHEYPVNEAGTSKKVTGAQVVTLMQFLHVLAANYTAAANVSLVAVRTYTINSGIKLTLGSAARLRIL